MPRRSPPSPRSHSRASIAASDTTYHSFRDIELEEPTTTTTTMDPSLPSQKFDSPTSPEMRRQDSGYQSLAPASSHVSRRRSSPTSAPSAQQQHPRPRPAARRSAKSAPVAHLPRSSGQSLDIGRTSTHSQQSYRPHDTDTFFHFPHFPYPEPAAEEDPDLVVADPEPPPQTTHYWTSDNTRRLEYAAIDAASRGVRGWVMRHVVPDCFIPKDRRRIRFEDDRGSVVRYRLDLDVDEDGEKDEREGGGRRRRRRAWWFRLRGN
ncbi:hypothetical protein QBC33DRAFT_580302 [Phialemonium atrogriseum]|uniref:Uncharacterized protein n=1 Tax=Phialemonium atrogriseum TaxID=1093897 RepID=A0AAJ0BVV0_9PEZI|nr:uncharacterized protein QBC33DRAFT_580302 [Phialemonium atrogriseum]KAK1764358.1 hypothetical protein QBC33DRAFT_580302 [Phialemonium atrogriseum]